MSIVRVCPCNDAACCEVPIGRRCDGCQIVSKEPSQPSVEGLSDDQAYSQFRRDRIAAANEYDRQQAGLPSSAQASDAARAALARPQVPDGFVLVPLKPTFEMLRAAFNEDSEEYTAIYQAMLAARPNQESQK